jgi:glycogen operon protein
MGDEVRRTQHGNNNAYCFDDDSNWFDWSLLVKHADVHRFAKLLIARRVQRDVGPEQKRMTLTQLISAGIKGWHGVNLHQPDWSDHSHSIALSVELPNQAMYFYLIFNAYWEPLEFELPRTGDGTEVPWRRWIDTFLEAPQDIVPWEEAPAVPGYSYRTGPRSVILLWRSR